MKKKLREAAAELPASASRISFLYIGRPYVGGFFLHHQRGACRQRYQLCARQGEGKEGGQAGLPRRQQHRTESADGQTLLARRGADGHAAAAGGIQAQGRKAVLAHRAVSAAGGLSGLDDGAVEQVLQELCGGTGRYPLQMGAGEGQGRQACHRQKDGTAQGEGERQAQYVSQKSVCSHCTL